MDLMGKLVFLVTWEKREILETQVFQATLHQQRKECREILDSQVYQEHQEDRDK
jgi:ssDNA-specific exonuclease RecJ